MEGTEAIIAQAAETAGLDLNSESGDTPVAEAITSDTPAAETAAEDTSVAETPAGETPPAVEGQPATPVVAGKRGAIPYEKHETILKNTREKVAAEFAPLQTEVETLRTQVQEFKQDSEALRLAQTNPNLFVDVMVKDETLGPLLRKVLGVADAAAPVALAPGGERPAPDDLRTDGSVGYTEEGLQKLLDWNTAQADARFQKMLDEKFGTVAPLVEERQAQIAFNQAIERTRPVFENAKKNWPKFEENQPAIKEHFAKNPGVTLAESYIAIVMPSLQSSEDAMRTKILAEMRTQSDNVIPVPGAIAAPAGGKRTTEDIIRERSAAAGLKL